MTTQEPTTRVQMVKYILTTIGIEGTAQDRIVDGAKINSPAKLSFTSVSDLEALEDDEVGKGDIKLLLGVKEWLQDHLLANEGRYPSSWVTEFTETGLYSFMAEKAEQERVGRHKLKFLS